MHRLPYSKENIPETSKLEGCSINNYLAIFKTKINYQLCSNKNVRLNDFISFGHFTF